jgi:hypothetical protein
MRMLRQSVALLAVLALMASSAQAIERPNIDDLITVIFEFDFTKDGKIQHIKVFRCEHPKDRSEAKGVLTAQEKAMGISIIASRPYRLKRDEIGPKRYDGILFDTRVRKYIIPTT